VVLKYISALVSFLCKMPIAKYWSNSNRTD